MSMFRPATKAKSRARIALDGPAGGGKTMSALRAAAAFGSGGKYPRVAVINTESGAIEKYLGLTLDGVVVSFDLAELPNCAPTSYTAAIREAGKMGYDVLIIDSLSHAWAGKDGALEQVNRKGGNSFTAWKDVTPQQNELIESILQSPCHVIATMRSKTEYVLEETTNSRGQLVQVPKRVGMAPVQRQGVEYEFDVVGELDLEHTLKITKTRCPEIDGAIVVKPGAAFWLPVAAWLADGVERKPHSPNGSARNDSRNGPPAEPHVIEMSTLDAGRNPDAPIGQEMLAELRRLEVTLGMTTEAKEAALKKRGVQDWCDLVDAQAREIVERLRRMELGFDKVPWERATSAVAEAPADAPPFGTDGPPSAEPSPSSSERSASTAAA